LLVRLFAARQRALRWPQPGWALGLFMVTSIGLPPLAPALSRTHWPGALGLLSGLALFSVTALASNTVAAARRASLAVLTLSGAVCALLVLSQAAGLRWLTEGLPTTLEFRSPGSFGNPNWAAAFLAPLAPLSLALAATSAASGWWRKFHRANATLLALATAATLSKGGLLSLAAGALVYALLDPRLPKIRRHALLGAMLAGALGVLLLAWHFDWWATAPWLRGRLFLWRVALWLASEHPLTGVGLAGYVAEYGPAAATLLQHDPGRFMPLSSVDFAHNDVLQFAAEGGVLSAAAFVLVGVQALRRATRRESDALERAAGAALAAIYVNGLADSPLREPATFALFFFLLGWLAPTAPAATAMPSPWTRRGVAALLALAGLLGALQGIRFTAGHLLWTRGRDAFKNDGSAAAAARALTDLSRARFYLPEHGRIASHYTLALARAGQWHAALEASRVTNSLHFDFDDQMLERDLEADLLSAEDAIALWQNFAARYPQLLTPQLRLGDLFLERGDVAAATRAYQRVLGASQDTPRAGQVREQARRKLRALEAERR
jgi:O-antigen ligase